MYLTPDERQVGKENFFAAIGSKHVRRTKEKVSSREFLLKGIQKPVASGKGLGAHYFGYEDSVKEPLRVGVIGTGDEGSVLIGAINPAFLEVKSIADIRPYSIYRAFQGEAGVDVRPGLIKVYGWKTEDAARTKVKVYGPWQDLIGNAKQDGIEAVIIALPLFLHAPVAIEAMKKGLHVLTEKLMAHNIGQCKDMARVAKQAKLCLAVGHQRHYSILYDNAVELIRNGILGQLHYISAQWHQADLPPPGKDSWKQPLPPGAKSLKEDPDSDVLLKDLKEMEEALAKSKKEYAKAKEDPDVKEEKKAGLEKTIKTLEAKIPLKKAQIDDKMVQAEKYAYEAKKYSYRDASGEVTYNRPAIEELIRWRLWDRTGGGLMAELGSHQLDASSIFVAAMHGGQKKHPLSVAAAANRPIFPPDRDIEDHVYCIFEFPAKDYDPKDPQGKNKKIGVQYSSINGNGFGGYGETVYGTAGTLILEREQEGLLYKVAATTDKTKVSAKKSKEKEGKEKVALSLDVAEDGDQESMAVGQLAMLEAKRGYTEELEHWAWCIRNPAPENQPRCHPKVAMGDAVIALTANLAARQGKRIDFDEKWFDPDSDETPDGSKPTVPA